jgi:AcrR family transcriptional regulator
MATNVERRGEGSVRDRLLAAADELFYAEGIHTVGIDRVIERAGVAKASLYGTFGSKDELVQAYLKIRAERRQARIEAAVARHEDPRDKILSVFDVLEERAREPDFRGCAFLNATAEEPLDQCKARPAALESRAWTRRLFVGLAKDLGAADAGELGRRLQILYDGAMIAASMEREHEAIAAARSMAEALLEGARRPPRKGGKRS